MRRFLLLVLISPVVLAASLRAYRVMSQDYHYNELVKLGDGLLADSLPLQASRTYGRAIELDPGNPVAYVKRADADRVLGNVASALQDLNTADSLSGDPLLVSARLAELYYETESFEDAARSYQKILEVDPSSPAILYRLGLVHFRAGHEAEAIEALNRAASLREGFWEAYYLRGAVFRAIGGNDEAESDFRTALSLAPEADLARAALVEMYLEQKRPDEAMVLVKAEIDKNPGAPSAYLRLADVHHLAGRNREAIEAVGLALEQDPNLPPAYLQLGELWLDEAEQQDDPVAREKALTALERAVKMDPASGAAALALGRAYLAIGDEEHGFSELQRASEATPVEAEALRLLGDLYRARHNPQEAVTAYHVYLKLSGDSPVVLERLGDAYVESGKTEAAAAVYMKLAALEPRRAAPLVKAARAFLRSGDSISAARACRQGLAANPENEALLELLERARSAAKASGRGGEAGSR